MAPSRLTLRICLVIFLAGFLVFGAISLFLGQDISWDLKNYHYYNAYALIHGRLEYDYAPAQLQTYIANPFLDLPFYILTGSLKAFKVGFLMGGIHGLNFGLLFLIAWLFLKHEKTRWRWFLSLLFSIAGSFCLVNIIELGTTMNDNLVSLFVLASLIVVLSRVFTEEHLAVGPALFLGNFLIGCGAGLKWTVLSYAGGFLIALFLASFLMGGFLKSCKVLFIGCLGLLAGILAVDGYWALQLWQKFGNPLFPFCNHLFKSPFIATDNLNPYLPMLPKTLIQAMFRPFYFVVYGNTSLELSFREITLATVYILFVIVLLVFIYRLAVDCWLARKDERSRHQPESALCRFRIYLSADEDRVRRLFIFAFFIASYIIWESLFSYYRYLIVLEFLSPLVIYLLLSILLKEKRIRLTVFLFILALVFLTTSYATSYGRMNWSDNYFDVRIPHVDQHSIVVFSSENPRSYLVPFFSPDIRFISIYNNFNYVYVKNEYSEEISKIIDGQKAPIYLLASEEELSQGQKSLAPYGLEILRSKKEKIHSKLDSDLSLYVLHKRVFSAADN